MTLSTRGYSLRQNAWSYEAHFTAALAGNVHNIRETLRAFVIPYFQRLIRERYGQDIPLEKIRGEVEREEQTLSLSPHIRVEPLETTYRGKIHHATKLPTLTLPSDIVAYNDITPPTHAELAWRLQYLLGDDSKRASLNRARLRAGFSGWNKLFAQIDAKLRVVYKRLSLNYCP